MPRVLTMSTSLTAAPSMSTTTLIPTMDTSLRSPMTELLYIPMPLLTLPQLCTPHLLFTLLLLSMLPLLPTLSTLLPLPTLSMLLPLPMLSTLLLSTVVLARSLTSPSPSLTRESTEPPPSPRLSELA